MSIAALPSAMEHVLRALREHGSLHDWAAAQPDATPFAGRAAAYRVRVAADAWLVRHYRRGGWVGRFVRDSYVRLGEPRPLRELRASAAARAAGVPTPQVVAAVTYEAGPVYRADLATRFVPRSADLAAVTWGAHRWNHADRVAAWRAAGELLRRTFDAGIVHADLNLRNILITRAGVPSVTALLLDLDRARIRERDDIARRTMLARLHRSRRRFEARFATPVGTAELHAFEAAVDGGADAPTGSAQQ